MRPFFIDALVMLLNKIGGLLNEFISIIVFSLLDLLDFLLSHVYKALDLLIESEWKSRDSSNIPVPESKSLVRITCSKQQLEEISDTLYARPTLLSKLTISSSETGNQSNPKFTLGFRTLPSPRWSDCHCKKCTSWCCSMKETLFVKSITSQEVQEDVVFIHGFISSSALWTETLFPVFSQKARSKYRMLAFDLLGFGRSPKPADSLYTLSEHLDMIHDSVLRPYNVKSYHIVAHSMGCLLALALAAASPSSIKSLTLIAPPCQPPGSEEDAMRRLAPRRVWPLLSFGVSVACWYEHISRTICLVICKNHRIWEFILKVVTANRLRIRLIEAFFLHTHNAAWHTLHNVICGTSRKMGEYLEKVRKQSKFPITIIHGEKDVLVPIECCYNVQSRVPRSKLRVLHKRDHLTVIVGRRHALAQELEEIWNSCE